MSKSVLIVDDDLEFLDLLRGIFEQAGYTVASASDASRGLEILNNAQIDLIITDQRLPGELSGQGYIQKIREQDADLPVIMISGYLDDDTIRDLIRDGVDGVFIKPLNIFSLLKKAGEVLSAGHSGEAEDSDSTLEDTGLAKSSNGIGPIEGLSEAGARFISRARELAVFRRNLLLIGPPGIPFEEIAVDIIGLGQKSEHCVTLKPGQVSWDKLEGFFAGEHAERRLALILEDAEKLTTQEVDNLVRLGDEKGGINGVLRLVFCLGETVEELYDAGSIDEEFYLFLGSNELRIPALKEMPEDLLAMAKREIEGHCEDFQFDMKIRSILLEQDWPENMLELRSVVIRAIALAQPAAPQSHHLMAAINKSSGGRSDTAAGSRSSMERFLKQEKERYSVAVDLLLNPDPSN